MKLLLSWLREYCPQAGSADEVAGELTRFGLEVEKIETLRDGDALLEVEVTSNRTTSAEAGAGSHTHAVASAARRRIRTDPITFRPSLAGCSVR